VLSKEKAANLKELLSAVIDKTMPMIMQEIMAAKDVSPDVKAARVGLASTALHHLKLLRAAIE